MMPGERGLIGRGPVRCDHHESMFGRCVACGMTWEAQTRARVARATLTRLRGAAYVAPLTDRDVLAVAAALPRGLTRHDADQLRAAPVRVPAVVPAVHR